MAMRKCYAAIGLVLVVSGFAIYFFWSFPRLSGNELVEQTMVDLRDHCIVGGKYSEERLKAYFLSRKVRGRTVKTDRGEGPLLIHVIDEMIWDPEFDEVTRENIYRWMENNKSDLGVDVADYYPPGSYNTKGIEREGSPQGK